MKDLYNGNQKHSCGKWKANKCKNITCSWVGNQYWCGENGSLLHCWWECKLVQPLWRTVWRFLKKTKNRASIWFSPLISGHIFRENYNLKRYMYTNVHCSPIYNSQDMEATDRWIDKEDAVHMYNGILLSNYKGWNHDVCSNIDGSAC